MKLLLPILALLVCVSADDWTVKGKEEMQKIRAECLAQHPLSPEHRDKLKQHKISNDAPARQYNLCKALKVGIFDHEHGFYVDRYAQQFQHFLNEERVKKIGKYCDENNPRGNQPDDMAFHNIFKCLEKMLTAAVGKHL